MFLIRAVEVRVLDKNFVHHFSFLKKYIFSEEANMPRRNWYKCLIKFGKNQCLEPVDCYGTVKQKRSHRTISNEKTDCELL